MGLTLKEPERKPKFLVPEGTYQAKCYTVADIGSHPNRLRGGELQQKVILIWELSELMPDGRPYCISERYTALLAPKANIRLLLEVWRGRAFSDEELQGFHLSQVLSKDCFLSIIHKENKFGEPFAKINGVIKPPKGTPPLISVNEPVFFDLDQFSEESFVKLPKWIQREIQQSSEWGAIMATQEKGTQTDLVINEGEDIPF